MYIHTYIHIPNCIQTYITGPCETIPPKYTFTPLHISTQSTETLPKPQSSVPQPDTTVPLPGPLTNPNHAPHSARRRTRSLRPPRTSPGAKCRHHTNTGIRVLRTNAGDPAQPPGGTERGPAREARLQQLQCQDAATEDQEK